MNYSKKSLRLSGFDYSSNASYFITILSQGRQKHFGEIRNGIMGLSEIGNTAAVYLQKIPDIRPNVELDEFMVMPDHVHCILTLKNANPPQKQKNRFGKPIANSISIIINRYKGAVKKWCNDNNFGYFEWQDKFYDHIIRNSEDFWTIKNYIINNPRTWWAKNHNNNSSY